MLKVTVTTGKAQKCYGDWSLYVTFPYDTVLVNIMRSFSTRYWHADKKQWELPYNKRAELAEKLNGYSVIFNNDALTKKNQDAINIEPVEFQYKTMPFQHQRVGFEYGLTHDRWLLGDEQGLGKTKQVIDIAVAKKIQKGYKHCLIVCGVNGLKWNWVNEIHTHSNEDAYILGQYPVKGKIKIGGNKAKLDDLRAIKHMSAYFIVTNVESLRNSEISALLTKLCTDKTIGMVVIDEIHKCKNPSSQQGKGLLKLQSECRIAMTGTPLMNTPMDLFIILKWLGYENHTFYAFQRHYCVMGGFGGYEIIGYRYLDELQERLNEIMLRRLKEDVLDLPPKIRVNEYVDMTAKQEQIYNEVHIDIKANIDQIQMSHNPLTELIRLRQATGYTGILSSTIKESAKLDRMEELVEEAVQNGKKVVIFSNWTQMTDVIRVRLAKKYKGVVITGQTNDADRQVNVNHFQNNPDCKYIIGTIGAMGTGLTLTAGTVEIFMDEPWNRALKEQAEDRCHRVGTTNSITIYTLICKDTIDERINDLVERKGIMADALVDGKIVGNKFELLNYLIN